MHLAIKKNISTSSSFSACNLSNHPHNQKKMSQFHIPLSIILLSYLISSVHSATFTITNNCDYTVWPGILSGAGTAPLSTTGFSLDPGESQSLQVPTAWSGRLWGRTLCSTDPSTGGFACATGDCGSGFLQCSGSGAAPPATLAEFTLNGDRDLDFYDVSLVDGYNLPMLISPKSTAINGSCSNTGCAADLNGSCPKDLKVVARSGSDDPIACKSACEAFGTAEYCCSGAYGNPDTCKPTPYSEVFKTACPRAYSYAYDDGTSTFTCGGGGDYVITFCPRSGGEKPGKRNQPEAAAGLPVINESMVFLSGDEVGGGRGRVSIVSPLISISLLVLVLGVSWWPLI